MGSMKGESVVVKQWFLKCDLRTITSASPGHLLELQIVILYPPDTRSETPVVRPKHLCFKTYPQVILRQSSVRTTAVENQIDRLDCEPKVIKPEDEVEKFCQKISGMNKDKEIGM